MIADSEFSSVTQTSPKPLALTDTSFLETILRAVTTQPDHIAIARTEDSRGVLLRVKASKLDMPRLIGKLGQNINALRLIMKLFAKDGVNISVILEEPN